ncbi:MAG: hypothetical protein ACPG7E_06335 [Marinirhabdus sp.]
MASKLTIEPGAQLDIDGAIAWHETKKVGLGLDFQQLFRKMRLLSTLFLSHIKIHKKRLNGFKPSI